MVLDRQEASKWLEDLHASSATLDADRWLDEFFTEDVSLQYSNNPVIQGPSVRAMFKTVFAKLDVMTHEVLYFDVVGSKIYQAAKIRYVVKGDDPERDVIEIPGFAVFFLRERHEERPKLYRAETYLNPTEIFSRITEKGL
ncbi:hypothetical protein LTR84_007444 [Exophiala bonariae]|uniref:SnoaL-like domain-containing protein n=1 Tax=Exophiala bonariae TaxID=1690606 RepID=A0AAV9MY91_9EURO|nr:hypothetical protein LTR84_007444 [Exophiala bonariae]